MKSTKSDSYKFQLEKRKEEILASLETLKEAAKPVDLNEPIGRLSRMDAIQQQQMALTSKKQLETTLEHIEQAFQRLHKGEYGYCLSCEDEIDAKRLKAKPEAPFCTDCQE